MQEFSHVLLLCGPSGGGKTTFAEQMRQGLLPSDIESLLPAAKCQWPVIDVTNQMRRDIQANGEEAVASRFSVPSQFVLHYDITTVYRYGLAGYASDPALRMLRLARKVQVVFVCPDVQRLSLQYMGRFAERQARKSRSARAWNGMVAPLRGLVGRVSGQPRRREKDFYSDPDWVRRCYEAWESYLGGLLEKTFVEGFIRVAPVDDLASSLPKFRIVSTSQAAI